MVEGCTSSTTCGRISQLKIHQLLSSGSQVISLVGLNGCEVPVIVSPPESLAKGANLFRGEPIYLQVDIPQSTTKEQELKALPLGSHATPILTASPIRAPPLKAKGQVSMTTEVRDLLSQVVLDTSGHASGSSTPKWLEPMRLVTSLPPKLEDFPKPVDTSSQVSTPDDADMEDASLEEILTASFPKAKTPGPSSDNPPLDAAHIQEEANKAHGDLLVIKSSIDTHQWKLVSDFSMALCQYESETTECIKEAKAICAHSIQEVKTHCSTAISCGVMLVSPPMEVGLHAVGLVHLSHA